MALLDMARRKYYVEAAHINYHKRDTAKRDEKLVRAYCRKHNIVFHLLNVYPEEVEGNFQAYARDRRYEFFNKMCKRHSLDAVLLGHHKDDHIETYLMQKQKKIGVNHYGLAFENIVKDVKVYRPLLEYSKQDLVDYCDLHDIEYGIDESNLEDDYVRNVIRHSQVEKMDVKQKELIVKEIDKLNKEKQKQLDVIRPYLDQYEYTIDDFFNVPYLEMFLRQYFPDKTERYLEEMIRQFKQSRKCSFRSKEKIIVKEYDKIHIFDIPKEYSYTFENIRSIRSKKYEYFVLAKTGNSLQGVTVSKDDFPVTIRNVRKDDEIKLKYGSKKLNRFFIDKKIYMNDRLTWPVVINRKGIAILVPGIGCNITHYSDKHNLFVIKL